MKCLFSGPFPLLSCFLYYCALNILAYYLQVWPPSLWSVVSCFKCWVSNFKVTNAFGVLYKNIRILCLTLSNEEFHVFFFIVVQRFYYFSSYICAYDMFELIFVYDMSKECEVFLFACFLLCSIVSELVKGLSITYLMSWYFCWKPIDWNYKCNFWNISSLPFIFIPILITAILSWSLYL